MLRQERMSMLDNSLIQSGMTTTPVFKQSRYPSHWAVILLLTAGVAVGCKPKSSAAAPASSAYFKTPFQTESEFIVEAIVSDLAEQMFYAASHRLPDKSHFLVRVQEKPGSPLDSPGYEVRVRLDPA